MWRSFDPDVCAERLEVKEYAGGDAVWCARHRAVVSGEVIGLGRGLFAQLDAIFLVRPFA